MRFERQKRSGTARVASYARWNSALNSQGQGHDGGLMRRPDRSQDSAVTHSVVATSPFFRPPHLHSDIFVTIRSLTFKFPI